MQFLKVYIWLLPLVGLCGKVAVSQSEKAHQDFPTGKYAAIVRGQAFRHGKPLTSCNADQKVEQIQMAKSFVQFVLEPMESFSRKAVDLVVTMPRCGALNQALKKTYGEERIKRILEDDFQDQGTGYRASLDLFKNMRADKLAAATEYSLIIVTRHDMLFKKNILSLHADWSKINFLGECEKTYSPPQGCLNDAIQTMPGTAFKAFDKAVCSACGCLKGGCVMKHGHYCKPVMEAAGLEVGLLTSWRPDSGLRDGTDPFSNIRSSMSGFIRTDDFAVIG